MTELAGRMEGSTHVLPLRVYFEDTDAAGMVYYANYLRYAERGRTDMLRLAGISHRDLLTRDGLALAVRRCEADYLAPARLDDEIEVHTRLLRVGGATLNADQTIRRDGTELMHARVRIACIDEGGRPKRLPGAVRDALGALCMVNAELT